MGIGPAGWDWPSDWTRLDPGIGSGKVGFAFRDMVGELGVSACPHARNLQCDQVTRRIS